MTNTKGSQTPLFTLDLGQKGGVFSPLTVEDMVNWIADERTFWSWISALPSNGEDYSIRQGLEQLREAIDFSRQLPKPPDSNIDQFNRTINDIARLLREAFLKNGLPHSSSTEAKRIDQYRKENEPRSALYFASVLVAPPIDYPFQPQKLNAWKGLIEGLVEKYNIGPSGQRGRRAAAEQSFEQLKAKADAFLTESTGSLHNHKQEYETLVGDINWQRTDQATKFGESEARRNEEFASLVAEHKLEMENLRKVFKEEIALRAPAAYWNKKHTKHAWQSGILGFISLASMVFFVFFIKDYVHELLGDSKTGTLPESWKIATLVLIGLFSVWAIRILVRMFLSQLHLTTDASERVVMIQTYLSLLEGDQLPSKEDRQLILQALFRPASDGIVKDEGLPPSVFEFMTRSSKT